MSAASARALAAAPFRGLPPIGPDSPARCAGDTAAAGVTGSPRHAVQGRGPLRAGAATVGARLRPATGPRPAAIQHSALSIQHCRRPPILRQMPEHLQK